MAFESFSGEDDNNFVDHKEALEEFVAGELGVEVNDLAKSIFQSGYSFDLENDEGVDTKIPYYYILLRTEKGKVRHFRVFRDGKSEEYGE